MNNVQTAIFAGSAARIRYSNAAIALHWLIAIAVLTNIALGLYMADLPNSDPAKFQIIQFHKSVGLTVLVLSLIRVAWRLVNPVPPLPADMNPLLKRLARLTQFLLYVLIVAIPFSGWLMVSASPLGLPTSYFGLFQWPHIWFLAEMTRAGKKAIVGVFVETHEFLAWSAIVLVALHVTGALYHHLIRRDGVLKSMLPGGG